MKKIILFDIDYTLFDTDKFRDIVYKKIAQEMSLSFDAKFKRYAKEAEEITVRSLGNYEPDFFIKTILELQKSSVSPEKLNELFWDKENFEGSIYDDVDSSIQNLTKIKDLIIGVLSTGENVFQRKKIEVLKKILSEDHVHIHVDKLSKLENILRKYKNDQVFIVDDLLAVLELAKRIQANVKTVHMNRKKSWEYSMKIDFIPDLELVSLEKLAEFVLKN